MEAEFYRWDVEGVAPDSIAGTSLVKPDSIAGTSVVKPSSIAGTSKVAPASDRRDLACEAEFNRWDVEGCASLDRGDLAR